MASRRRAVTGGRTHAAVRRYLAAVLIAFIPSVSSAGAQDYRQTVVVTAAATAVELGTVTRTLVVITREEIAALPVQSVADVLRLTSSVDVRERGERGVQSDFSVRGAGFGQMLVLVDGVRINDAQSGHHNGDIPVPLQSVERIEVLYGPGSSLFGADAFGGTVNVITRPSAPASLILQGGSFGFGAVQGQAAATHGDISEALAASANRSSGFTYDRDFKTAVVQSRTAFGEATHASVSFLWKAFGANNFYGGNAPSREWTNQTLLAADHRLGEARGWRLDADASYRTHGDHFIFNQRLPALSDNSHRTHAAVATLKASRRLGSGSTATAGAEAGGDWIRSTNLGDHAYRRVSGFAEWRRVVSPAMQLDASLRVDRYSEFGAAWSPSLGAGWWPSAAVRVRASAGRAFRVPTFTERYYSDPANLARPEVGPEKAWAGEGGVDLFLRNGWLAQATIFGRADRDVIDWLRPTIADRWRTYNVRNVATRGIELSLRKSLPRGSFVQAAYTGLDLDATAVTQLSKYLLDYAPRSFVGSASMQGPGGLRLAPRIEYRRRTRSSGRTDYVVLDARVARRVSSLLDVWVEGTNLLDRTYQEVAGVAMPGAAMTVSLVVGRP
jgi:iron complex outermembrane receptor protein